jgi:hypothetical protein
MHTMSIVARAVMAWIQETLSRYPPSKTQSMGLDAVIGMALYGPMAMLSLVT